MSRATSHGGKTLNEAKGKQMKYAVTVAFSILQTIEVDADSREEAKQTAWDLFDQTQAELGEGEIINITEGEASWK